MIQRTKVVVVLGSGRSMTSGVAKGMHKVGFPMGEPMVDASPSNPWGHYEHQPLVALNDRILHHMGSAWDDPPPMNPPALWADAVRDNLQGARDYLQARFLESGQFGMKDPRVTLLWPVWAEAFRQLPAVEPILVVAHRSTQQAAESLAARDKLPMSEAKALVRQYQGRACRILMDQWG